MNFLSSKTYKNHLDKQVDRERVKDSVSLSVFPFFDFHFFFGLTNTSHLVICDLQREKKQKGKGNNMVFLQ